MISAFLYLQSTLIVKDSLACDRDSVLDNLHDWYQFDSKKSF